MSANDPRNPLADPLDQFRVDRLQVDRLQNASFQLTEASVSPVRVVGRTKYGEEIYETIPAVAKHAKFVDPAGNICDVALRTGRMPSQEPEAIKYEMIVMMDQLRSKPFPSMPLEICPHTQQYAGWIHGPGPLIPGGTDCGGRPGAQRLEDACPHMQEQIKMRRARQLEITQLREEEMRGYSKQQATKMFASLVEWAQQESGEAEPAKGDPIRRGRKRLSVDEADPDPKQEEEEE